MRLSCTRRIEIFLKCINYIVIHYNNIYKYPLTLKLMKKTLLGIVLGSAIALNGCECGDSDANNNLNKFTREKVLTISAKEYCENKGTNLADYELIGVSDRDLKGYSFAGLFIKSVPSGTEVIVDYRIGGTYEAGTALIPKKKKQ